MKNSPALSIGLIFGLLASPMSFANDTTPNKPAHAAIASAHPLATQAGLTILEQGGNAFDAAVAVTAALAVVEPQGSGLGGGGFWLLHRESDGMQVVVDGRETAPAAATRDIYLDEHGQPIKDLSRVGALAAAIPGTPAALAHINDEYGRLSLADNLAPAIQLAQRGFKIDSRLAQGIATKQAMLREATGEAGRVLLTRKGKPLKQGKRLKQTHLANTLSQIAKHGHAGFYEGDVAQQLVAGVNSQSTWWSMDDLKQYQVKERQPLVHPFKTRHSTLVTAPLPSSCGHTLVNALNITHQAFDNMPPSVYAAINTDVPGLAKKHMLIEAWRRAYHNRALYLGDPAFLSEANQTHAANMLQASTALEQLKTIRLDRNTPSHSFTMPEAHAPKGRDTTHFSILDQYGNRVSATMSINFWFGSGIMPEGTGVMLNNEMDDFSIKPGVANGFGLVGARANEIAPGKRPLSSMCPSFFEFDDGQQSAVAILGTPGGSRIISMMTLALELFEPSLHQPEVMVNQPRFHHQFLPDVVYYEPHAFSQQDILHLEDIGHTLQETSRLYGNMQMVFWHHHTNKVATLNDPRGLSKARIY